MLCASLLATTGMTLALVGGSVVSALAGYAVFGLGAATIVPIARRAEPWDCAATGAGLCHDRRLRRVRRKPGTDRSGRTRDRAKLGARHSDPAPSARRTSQLRSARQLITDPPRYGAARLAVTILGAPGQSRRAVGSAASDRPLRSRERLRPHRWGAWPQWWQLTGARRFAIKSHSGKRRLAPLDDVAGGSMGDPWARGPRLASVWPTAVAV